MNILKAFSVSTVADAGQSAQAVPKINHHDKKTGCRGEGRGGLTAGFRGLTAICALVVSAVLFFSCKGAGAGADGDNGGRIKAPLADGGAVHFVDAAGNITSTINADTVFEVHVFTDVSGGTLTVSTAASAPVAASVTAIAGGGGGGGQSGNAADFAGGGGAGGPGIALELLSTIQSLPLDTLYASGGKGGGRVSVPALDGQRYGDGGGAACHTEAVGAAAPGKAGHQGILYVVIPFTGV